MPCLEAPQEATARELARTLRRALALSRRVRRARAADRPQHASGLPDLARRVLPVLEYQLDHLAEAVEQCLIDEEMLLPLILATYYN